MYKVNVHTARIARELGISEGLRILESMMRGGYEYFRATCKKPQEYGRIRRLALKAGFQEGPTANHGGNNYFPSYYKRKLKEKRKQA